MRTLAGYVVLAALIAAAGCTPNVKQAAEPPAEPERIYAGPPATDSPATWTKGKVFQVWPYGNGELMAYLGVKDGIRTGDLLALQRGGLTINSIEVIEVRDVSFFGRIVRRDDPGLWPKVGDMAAILPPTN